MADTVLAKAVLPSEVARSLLTRGQHTFAADYRDTLLLLVGVTLDSEVLVTLAANAADGGKHSFLPIRRLDYATEVHDRATLQALLSAPAPAKTRTVGATLREGPHFVVPLRKRALVDQMSADRISVGRATNKDIVLRDATISKSHAWFELHEGRDFSVADAGSTNYTWVNGEILEPRRPRSLAPGDLLRFGSITALLCTGEALWSAIHEAG